MLPLRSESYSDIIIFYMIFFNMVCNFLGAQGETKNPLKFYFLVIGTSPCRHQCCSNLLQQ